MKQPLKIEFKDDLRRAPASDERYDLFLSALGYERRCVHIPCKLRKRIAQGYCFQFGDRNVLSFEKNKRTYGRLGFTVIPWESAECVQRLRSQILPQALESGSPKPQIAVDISSMTRELAAHILFAVMNSPTDEHRTVDVSLFYSPAKYVRPASRLVPVVTAGPVINEYAGWSAFPERPSVAAIGLGYEYGRAIGVLDYLDASDTWLFVPMGKDERYDRQVQKINADLLALQGAKRQIPYNVYDPYDTIIKLRSLAEGIGRFGRLVLVPFGPKLFNAINVVVAEMFRPHISVWRVSGGALEAPIDRFANGDIIQLRFFAHHTSS